MNARHAVESVLLRYFKSNRLPLILVCFAFQHLLNGVLLTKVYIHVCAYKLSLWNFHSTGKGNALCLASTLFKTVRETVGLIDRV